MPAQPMPDGRVPVILSAHDERLIRQDAAAILDYLTRLGNDLDPTPDVAATVLRLRRLRRHRAVVRAGGRDELVSALSAVAQGTEHPLVARSSAGAAACPAFVFPGQGSQWRAMGADAYRGLAAYRAEADRCAAAFARAGWPSPLPYLIGDDDREWSRTEIQGAQFVHAAGLAAQWKSHGILPGVTVGHSLGEVAAAYVAEKISLGDAVALVGARATAVDRLTGQFAMVVLGLDVDAARALIAEVPGWLEVSAVNGPSATVVSGNHDPVIALAELAGRRDVFAHKLVVDYPGHTSALRPLTTSLAAQLPDSRFRDTPVAFVSSAVGGEVGASIDFGRYWIESLCTTVRFDRAVVAAQHCGANAFIEMSAHPTLLYPLTDITEDAAVIMGSGHRDHAIVDVLSANIAAAAAADPHFRWTDLIPAGPNRPLRGFPNAPMRSQHLWVTSQPAAAHQVLRSVPVTVALETWRRAEDFHHNGTVPTGIAVVGAGHLSGALAEAAANHHHCRVVPVDEADIVAVVAPTFEERGAVGALTALASRADAGVPDYDALIGPRCRTVWLVTAGAEHVLDDDVVARPAHSALAAMHRSVGFEFADQNFGNLDLPADALDSGAAAAAVEALLGVPGVMAVRSQNGRAGRYVRALVESAEPAAVRSPDTSVLRTVVITGGSGAIGLRYARHCVERGAQTVILLSRNGVDARLLAELSAGHQVEIHAPRCDITDRSAVAATAARYGATGATLLIHTAGIAQAAARADLTGADVAAVCAAKVYGLAAMAQEWPQQPGCRIIACSSVFGVWGGHGHAAYAASNRLLDVLVAQLRAGGTDCTSIRWGLWQDAGVVEAAEIARTERSGLVAMDPDRAIAAGFGRYCGDPLVFDADFDRLRVFLDSQAIPATLASLSDDTSDGPLGDVGTRPLAEVVHAELSATLQLGSGEPIDATASLIDLGLDSLLALDLRRRLRRAVGRSAPVARMLGGITVSELIDVLDAGPALDRDPGKVGIHA